MWIVFCCFQRFVGRWAWCGCVVFGWFAELGLVFLVFVVVVVMLYVGVLVGEVEGQVGFSLGVFRFGRRVVFFLVIFRGLDFEDWICYYVFFICSGIFFFQYQEFGQYRWVFGEIYFQKGLFLYFQGYIVRLFSEGVKLGIVFGNFCEVFVYLFVVFLVSILSCVVQVIYVIVIQVFGVWSQRDQFGGFSCVRFFSFVQSCYIGSLKFVVVEVCIYITVIGKRCKLVFFVFLGSQFISIFLYLRFFVQS